MVSFKPLALPLPKRRWWFQSIMSLITLESLGHSSPFACKWFTSVLHAKYIFTPKILESYILGIAATHNPSSHPLTRVPGRGASRVWTVSWSSPEATVLHMWPTDLVNKLSMLIDPTCNGVIGKRWMLLNYRLERWEIKGKMLLAFTNYNRARQKLKVPLSFKGRK